MLRILAFGFGVLVAAILVSASIRPDTLHVERSTTIDAPPAATFARINDFHRWTEWSPYENKDPDMKRSYSGADSGVGAIYNWEGDSNVGSGRMEILESESPAKVRIKLDFITPFEGHNVAEFSLRPEGERNVVTWAMDGPSPFLGKVIGLFLDMDGMIGGDFEAGLARLKSLAEKEKGGGN